MRYSKKEHKQIFFFRWWGALFGFLAIKCTFFRAKLEFVYLFIMAQKSKNEWLGCATPKESVIKRIWVGALFGFLLTLLSIWNIGSDVAKSQQKWCLDAPRLRESFSQLLRYYRFSNASNEARSLLDHILGISVALGRFGQKGM